MRIHTSLLTAAALLLCLGACAEASPAAKEFASAEIFVQDGDLTQRVGRSVVGPTFQMVAHDSDGSTGGGFDLTIDGDEIVGSRRGVEIARRPLNTAIDVAPTTTPTTLEPGESIACVTEPGPDALIVVDPPKGRLILPATEDPCVELPPAVAAWGAQVWAVNTDLAR